MGRAAMRQLLMVRLLESRVLPLHSLSPRVHAVRSLALRLLALQLLALHLLAAAGCKPAERREGAVHVSHSMEEVMAVQERHTAELMATPGVAGVAVGALEDGTFCIKILVVRQTNELRRRLPRELEGVTVVIEESGEIRPLR